MASFETMDWETEAERIRRAFGVTEECLFCPTPNGKWGLKTKVSDQSHLLLPAGYALFVYYDPYGRRFHHGQYIGDEWDWDSVRIEWYGAMTTKPTFHRVVLLAKGLFYLDLLTTEVEAALDVSISAHQKAEWLLEYQSRMKD